MLSVDFLFALRSIAVAAARPASPPTLRYAACALTNKDRSLRKRQLELYVDGSDAPPVLPQ